MMKGKSKERIEQAKACFAVLGDIRTSSLFGGYGLLADGMMFAAISDGELYLRATGSSLESAFHERGMTKMIYSKRGAPMKMRYYWVDESLWQEHSTLLALAKQVVCGMRKEINIKNSSKGRLKDLPNIDAAMERLLWRCGTQNIYDLRLLGARHCYLKLLQQQKRLGISVLMALAGAIAGYHHAALPTIQRKILTEWFEATMPQMANGAVR